MEVISQQQSKNETDGVSSSTLIWENRFKELCDYKRKHGDCLVTQSHLLQISGGYRRLGESTIIVILSRLDIKFVTKNEFASANKKVLFLS